MANWRAWFARDGFLWWACFWGGSVAVALSFAPQAVLDTFPAWLVPAMPTIRLVAFVVAVVGGKMGMSPADIKANIVK